LKCPKCGEETGENAKYCSRCGFNLKADSVEVLKIRIDECRHDIYQGFIIMGLGFVPLILAFWFRVTGFLRELFFLYVLVVGGSLLILLGVLAMCISTHAKAKLLKQLES